MNANDIVYRYMRYTEFLDIIRFQRLTLKYPGLWPDKLEALFLKHFENDDNVKKVIDIYKSKYDSYTLDDIKSDLQIISSVLIKTRCQCWSHKEDDLVMWNERGGSEIVRIAVPKKSFDKYRECGLIHRAINYVAKVDLNQLLERFVKDRIVTEFILMKKSVFEYEDEYSLDEISEELFISILDYLCHNEHFDILNLSLGISAVSQYNRLEQVCKKISDNGTLIVASFNNFGTVTYPAAFPFVLGVDWDIECKRNNDFIYCENGIVDVYGKGINRKLKIMLLKKLFFHNFHLNSI
mgnify:CR=1 FL=1